MQFTEGLFILKKSPIPKIFGDDKMIATILTATAVYVATGIDYLVILILLFSQVKKGQVKHIWIGQYIGTAIVIGASLLVAQGVVNLIPQQFSSGKFNQLFLTMTFIVLASSADDFSIYIPYFTTLSMSEIFIVTIVFLIMVGVLCYVSYRLASFDFISETIEKYERWIVPIVFIGLGIYILFENGTFNALISFLL